MIGIGRFSGGVALRRSSRGSSSSSSSSSRMTRTLQYRARRMNPTIMSTQHTQALRVKWQKEAKSKNGGNRYLSSASSKGASQTQTTRTTTSTTTTGTGAGEGSVVQQKHYYYGGPRRSLFGRVVGSVTYTVKTCFALIGIITVGMAVGEYRQFVQIEQHLKGKEKEETHDGGGGGDDDDDDDDVCMQRRKLVIPFHRLKVVEKKSNGWTMDQISSFANRKSGGANSDDDDDDDVDGPRIEIEIRELIDLIHEAAIDPSIDGMIGIFGQAGQSDFSTGGWAHVEEIKNALRVFQESHRTHYEPTPLPNNNNQNNNNNYNHNHNINHNHNKKKKTMIAYADSFHNNQNGNMEYYLASMFHRIAMQEQGYLNLFGLTQSTIFVRDALYKYGIDVHVFKHGNYKNTPNAFTQMDYTKHHVQNILNILEPLNQYLCNHISMNRTKATNTNTKTNANTNTNTNTTTESPTQAKNKNKNQTNNNDNQSNTNFRITSMDHWKLIHNSGSFTATMAKKIGFIDDIVKIDPLSSQNTPSSSSTPPPPPATTTATTSINNNNINSDNNSAAATTATTNRKTTRKTTSKQKKITLLQYKKFIQKRNKVQERKWQLYSWMKRMAQKYPFCDSIYKTFGYGAPFFNIPESEFSKTKAKASSLSPHKKESIALMHIQGIIQSDTAKTIMSSLRKIKQDPTIKCVIVRVDSPGGSPFAAEMIYQECKHLPQKVIYSFGNVSASAGYYIATSADRIFASTTTITGSIGVFGMKFNFNGFLQQYGMTVRHISTSQLASSDSLFAPIHPKIDENYHDIIDHLYHQFKTKVSINRNLSMDDVQSIAQGKVYIATQAKQLQLIDDMGGIHRAIAYAKRNYCNQHDDDDDDGTDAEVSIQVWPDCQYTWQQKLKQWIKQQRQQQQQQQQKQKQQQPAATTITTTTTTTTTSNPLTELGLSFLSMILGDDDDNHDPDDDKKYHTAVHHSSPYYYDGYHPFLPIPLQLFLDKNYHHDNNLSGIAMTLDENTAIDYLLTTAHQKTSNE